MKARNTVNKYQTKPVVKEAIQHDGTWETYNKIQIFVGMDLGVNKNGTGLPDELIIPTLEGELIADKSDYIIKGVKGECYPCKPDIFWMTYEDVNKGQKCTH